MKIKSIIYLILLITTFLFLSCKHDNKNTLDKGGRVVLVNSDTGVPSALVRFLKLDDGGSWVQSYTQVGSAITDANGNFDAPDDLDASIARAYGLDSIYENPSYDVGYGDNMRLELVPPAWLSVTAVDIEPLNPEVIYAKVYTNSPITDWQTVNDFEPIIIKTAGIQMSTLLYFLTYSDQNIESYSIPLVLPPFDTTSYIIQY